MKKILSLLTVALFATTFAAGCGKYTKCSEAGKEDCDKADKFDKDSGDKGNCKWDAAADNNKGKCVVKGTVTTTEAEYKPSAADQKVCTDITGVTAAGECKTKHDALAAGKQISQKAKDEKYECQNNAANNGCELKKKSS